MECNFFYPRPSDLFQNLAFTDPDASVGTHTFSKKACVMTQIQVPINRSEIYKEIHFKYQIIWKTQYNTNIKGHVLNQ